VKLKKKKGTINITRREGMQETTEAEKVEVKGGRKSERSKRSGRRKVKARKEGGWVRRWNRAEAKGEIKRRGRKRKKKTENGEGRRE